MTQDDFDHRQFETPDSQSAPRLAVSGRLMAAGVVSALALGCGLGLWARPAPPTRPPAARLIAPEDAPRPALQIVVDDTPAPLGPLLEVLPADAAANAATPSAAPPAPIPEPVAPRRPAAGLMKVDAIVAAEPLLVPAVRADVKPKAGPKPKLDHKAKAPDKPQVQKAKAALKTRLEKPRVAEVGTAAAKASKPGKAMGRKLAKAETGKVEKAKPVKLAKVEAHKVKAGTPKAEPKRLAALSTKLAPKSLRPKSVQKLVIEKAASKPRVVATKPAARKPVSRGGGPLRVARNDACASPDAGAAAVCADRSLTARDRQMQQAYRNAEAAGVPATALRRQQARWLQARAAAAREATWAVEDVYTARISELNDLTRDARDN